MGDQARSGDAIDHLCVLYYQLGARDAIRSANRSADSAEGRQWLNAKILESRVAMGLPTLPLKMHEECE